MKKTLSIILSIVLIVASVTMFLLMPRHGRAIKSEEWKGEQSFNIQDIQTLQKKKGEDFKILQLSDIQMDVPFKNKDYLKNSIDEMVKENKPDLIVLTGDNVAGVFMHFHIKTVVKIIDSYGIPWATVFGNHDREFGNNLNYQARQFMKSENSLFQVGPSNIEGLGNYVINIEEDGNPIYSLFMIDSNSEIIKKVNGETEKYFDSIHTNQINWYKDNVAKISEYAGHNVKSMAFFHIPVQEFQMGYDLAIKGDQQSQILFGSRNEEECDPKDNSGFFKVFKENGGTHMFAAHDHINDYSVKYQDVVMTYGIKTGDYSGHNEQMGGVLITINDTVTVKQIVKPMK